MALGRLLDRLDQVGHPRHVHLVLGALEGRPQQLAERVELAAEIRLVEVPAADDGRERRPLRRAHPERAHRNAATASAISAGTRSRTALAVTLTALVTARAFERPWHLMKRFSKPRIGAPPYCV